MKKLVGGILNFLAFLLITAALTVPLLGMMMKINATAGAAWLNAVYGNPWIAIGVTAGACAFLLLIGSLINSRLKKMSYVFSLLFGAGAFGALMYLVCWGGYAPATPILAVLNVTLANNTLIYIAAGAMALGLILSAAGRVLRRKGRAASEYNRRKKDMEAHEAYVPTSRDTDLAIASSRTPKIERYVRDPWGNLIKEEDYNERIRSARDKRL